MQTESLCPFPRVTLIYFSFLSFPAFRQHKLEEALLFSGQFAEALQALVDWLYRVEPQLSEDLYVHGDLDLVTNLMDSHKVCEPEIRQKNRVRVDTLVLFFKMKKYWTRPTSQIHSDTQRLFPVRTNR